MSRADPPLTSLYYQIKLLTGCSLPDFAKTAQPRMLSNGCAVKMQ